MHPRLAALLLAQILPVFSVVAPCRRGASPVSVPTPDFHHGLQGDAGEVNRAQPITESSHDRQDCESRYRHRLIATMQTVALLFLTVAVAVAQAERPAPQRAAEVATPTDVSPGSITCEDVP